MNSHDEPSWCSGVLDRDRLRAALSNGPLMVVCCGLQYRVMSCVQDGLARLGLLTLNDSIANAVQDECLRYAPEVIS